MCAFNNLSENSMCVIYAQSISEEPKVQTKQGIHIKIW